MKKSEIEKLVSETVQEVLKEVLTQPVQKDPALMSDEEKKQALLVARQKAGSSDPNEPIDLVKNEVIGDVSPKKKLREMPRTAIMYKLADDYEKKYEEAAVASKHPKWYQSTSRKRWMDGIIDYLKEPEHSAADITTIAKEKFNVPQPMLADYGRELIGAGVLVPVGMKGRELGDDEEVPVPQFLKKHTDPETGEELSSEPSKLSRWGKTKDPSTGKWVDVQTKDDSIKSAEDLFIGGGFNDDFSDTSTDTIPYHVINPDGEPDEEDGIEKAPITRSGGLTSDDADVLMKFDRLTKDLANIKGNLRRKINSKGGIDEISDLKVNDAASQRRLHDLYARKREELKDLIRLHGDLIQKYRNIGKMANIIHKSGDDEVADMASDVVDDTDTSAPLNESMVQRFQKLANIK